MIRLERLTAEFFNNYARQVTSGADWRYLSKERQYEWQLEMAQRIKACLFLLEQEVNIPKRQTTGQASFEKGFILGEIHENDRLKNKIKELQQSLEDQIEALHADCEDRTRLS